MPTLLSVRSSRQTALQASGPQAPLLARRSLPVCTRELPPQHPENVLRADQLRARQLHHLSWCVWCVCGGGRVCVSQPLASSIKPAPSSGRLCLPPSCAPHPLCTQKVSSLTQLSLSGGLSGGSSCVGGRGRMCCASRGGGGRNYALLPCALPRVTTLPLFPASPLALPL